MRFPRAFFLGFGLAIFSCAYSQAQAALFMESADGIPSLFNPTGHEAVYFARICAETPTHLRRCGRGELGVVISRYQGIGGYDWVAIPLVPYLYSVENVRDVPQHVNREMVNQLRLAYHAAHLKSLGSVPEGGRIKRGWIQLLGASYERRIYAFRFETTAGQDDAFIAWMNDSANRSHFSLLFHNCSDFASRVLNFYFPGTFRRHWAPDAGITTPRQVAYELVQYARRHQELRLSVEQIPLIPGYQRLNRQNESASKSLLLTGVIVPVALLNPFVAAAIAADSLLWGWYPLPLTQAGILSPASMEQLAAVHQSPGAQTEHPAAAGH